MNAIADITKSKSLGLSARQMPSISETLNHVPRVTTSTALKQKLLSVVGTLVPLLFKGFHTNDLEASNDTRGVGSQWRLAKSRVDNNPTLCPTLYNPPTSPSSTSTLPTTRPTSLEHLSISRWDSQHLMTPPSPLPPQQRLQSAPGLNPAIISHPTTISGILCEVAPNGARTVPSSRRANGTIRPEIGIRLGYIPSADVR